MAKKTHCRHGLSDYSLYVGAAQSLELHRDDGRLRIELSRGCVGYSVRTFLNNDMINSCMFDSIVDARKAWQAEVVMRCTTELRLARGHIRHLKVFQVEMAGGPMYRLEVDDEFYCLADTRSEAWAEGYNQLRKLGWLSKSASN